MKTPENVGNDITRALGPDDSALIEIVVALYQTERISAGLAAEMLGTDHIGFWTMIDERGLDVSNTLDEVDRDIQSAERISKRWLDERRR